MSYGGLAPEPGNTIAVGLCALVNYTAADCFIFGVTRAQQTMP